MKSLMMAAVLALAAGAASAQNPTEPGSQPATPGAATAMGGGMSEANVLAMIKAINDHEIKEGKLAEIKSKSKGVLNFARMMVHDHGQSNREVAAAAKRLGVTPEANDDVDALKRQGRDEYDSAKGLSGAAFDAAYADQMVKGHQAALRKLDALMSASPARSADFSSLLTKTREMVMRHLDAAQKLQASLGGAQGGLKGQ